MNVIEANGLGKRYGSTRALCECSLAIPEGHVAALVGPNGAGKSTLLNLAVGLSAPSEGGLTVLGGCSPGSPTALDGIAFVAQDTPLYKNLSAADAHPSAVHVAIVTDDAPGKPGPDVVNGDGDRTGFSVVETGTDQVQADAGHGDSMLAGYVSPPPAPTQP
jgi:ABC-type Fe3+/spermidine/putrescine transport system ATPase subunit